MDEEVGGVLFILKESLLKGDRLSPGFGESLQKIAQLVDEDPRLLGHLSEWGFLEKQLPHLLRSSGGRRGALALGTRILQLLDAVLPPLFVTRKGGFFFSELLYESLDRPEGVIGFCTEAVRKSPLFINMLYDTGFFILVNSVVSREAAEFYSCVFEFREQEERTRVLRKGGEDVMYEIRRRYFDPEIVFREEGFVVLRDPCSRYRAAQRVHRMVFDDLYNTTFFSLLDLGLEMNLHLMNYCQWDYTVLCGSSDLRELIINNSYLAVRLYRRMLDSLRAPDRADRSAIYLSRIEDSDLMIHVSRLLEAKETEMVMESALVLHSYYDLLGWDVDQKQFSEARIRRLLHLLELCDSGCMCLRECAGEPQCLERCEVRKILALVSQIYSRVEKEFFYKPSFLALLVTWSDIFSRHGCWDCPFFTVLFSDVAAFLGRNPYNFARIVFPFKKTRRRLKHTQEDSVSEIETDAPAVHNMQLSDSEEFEMLNVQ